MELTAANGGSPAADGSKWRRQLSVSGGSRRQVAATYSVAAAAQELGIPERTLREWIRLGKVEATPPRPGERGSRISAPVLEELRTTREGMETSTTVVEVSEPAASGGNWRQAAADGGERQRQAAAEADSSPLNGARHDVSPPAAGGEFYQRANKTADPEYVPRAEHTHHAELIEQQRDQALSEVAHLRAQLDVRAEEIRRHSEAEAELRRLLLTSQQLAHELAQQVEVKALPPGPEILPMGKKQKVRWWMPWRR